MYEEELIEQLRTATTLPVMNDLCQRAANAIEYLNRKVEEYKTEYYKEHKKRIAEIRYLYDELTKCEREKLLMTPIRIEVTKLPKEGEEK